MSVLKKYPRIFLTLLLFIMLLGAIFLYFNLPGKSQLLPRCIFHSVTHLYCPGCGSTRAVYSIIHGDILTALRCNALVIIFIPILAYSFISFVINTYLQKQLLKPITFTPFFCKAIVIFVISFWILRNIPFIPFSYLAPISLV